MSRMSPHFSLKVSRWRQNYPRSLSSPGALRPHTGVRCTDILGTRRPVPTQSWISLLSWVLAGAGAGVAGLCVCFGNGSDVNPDLNRNKKPVADIPWGNQTNVQAPRSITSRLIFYFFVPWSHFKCSFMLVVWLFENMKCLQIWNGLRRLKDILENFTRTICAVDIYLNLGWISLWYDLIT